MSKSVGTHPPVTLGTQNGLSLSGQVLSLGLAVAGGANGALSGTDKTKLDATSGTNSGDVTIGAPAAASNNGLSLSGQVLSSTPADATHPGHVTTGAQTFAGTKTFAATLDAPGMTNTAGATSVTLTGTAPDGATAIAVVINNSILLQNTGAKILSLRNNNVERASFDMSGRLTAAGVSSPSLTINTQAGLLIANTLQASAGGTANPAKIAGNQTDVAGAVLCKIVNVGAPLTNSLAKICQFYSDSGSVERAYVSQQGNYVTTGGLFSATGGAAVTLQSSVVDSALAVASILNNSVTLANAAAKLLSIQNNAAEKLFVDPNGAITVAGSTTTPLSVPNNSSLKGAGTAGPFLANTNVAIGLNNTAFGPSTANTALQLVGNVTDGGTARALKFGNLNTLATAGAKIASFYSDAALTTEVAYLDKDGNLVISGSLTASAGGGGTPTNVLRGTVAGGSAGPAVTIGNTNAMSSAGAKVVSVFNDNMVTEKFYIDKDGNGWFAGTVTASGGAVSAPANILQGTVADGATAVATKIQNSNALSTAGAKIASFFSDNGTTERGFVDKDGGYTAKVGNLVANVHTSLATNSVTLRGQMADGASAISVILNSPAYANTAAKLVSFQNNSSEVAYVDYAGNGVFPIVKAPVHTSLSTSVTLMGQTTDGAPAVATILDNAISLVTIGAKLLSIRNAGAEKLSVDKDGALVTGAPITGSRLTSTNEVQAVDFRSSSTSVPTKVLGVMADGATAVAVAVDVQAPAYANASAKILSIRNSGTEVAFVDKDGMASVANLTGRHATPTYGVSVAVNAKGGWIQTITATDGVAFTVANPTNAVAGQELTIRIKNTSGGALGALSWGNLYKVGSGWAQPATGFSRSITFFYDGTNWIEVGRTAQDIPN